MTSTFLPRAFSGIAIATLVCLAPLHVESRPAPRCTVNAAAVWVNGPTPKLRLEAFSDGARCASAITVFAVRDGAGKILFSHSYTAEFVAPTSDVRTMAQMRVGLASWLGAGRDRTIHANLPNWIAGAAKPVDIEFPFIPDDTITRDDYLAIKANRTPVLCYAQGIESLNCLVYRNGDMEPFGVQLFPG